MYVVLQNIYVHTYSGSEDHSAMVIAGLKGFNPNNKRKNIHTYTYIHTYIHIQEYIITV